METDLKASDFARLRDPLTRRLLCFHNAKARVLVLFQRGVYTTVFMDRLGGDPDNKNAYITATVKPDYLPD